MYTVHKTQNKLRVCGPIKNITKLVTNRARELLDLLAPPENNVLQLINGRISRPTVRSITTRTRVYFYTCVIKKVQRRIIFTFPSLPRPRRHVGAISKPARRPYDCQHYLHTSYLTDVFPGHKSGTMDGSVSTLKFTVRRISVLDLDQISNKNAPRTNGPSLWSGDVGF